MSTRSQPSNCLFLPELPDDLPDDTLERHFRGYEGYISSRTRKDRYQKTVGFVEFELIEQAVRCREEMQDQSPFGGLTWHIHYSNNPGRGAAAAPSKRPRDEPMREPVERRDAQRVGLRLGWRGLGAGRGARAAAARPAGAPRPAPRPEGAGARERGRVAAGDARRGDGRRGARLSQEDV